MIKDNENVAIIIATHNNAKTIKKAVESVTEGIRGADRIIVGDNDSNDGTYEVLCDMVGASPIQIEDKTGLPPQYDGALNGTQITIFKKKFSTTGHTLNVAMQMKWQGVTIFGFMEPTSWYAPDKIKQAIRVFHSNRAIACVVSDYDNEYEDGRIERIFEHSFDGQRLLYKSSYDGNLLVKSQIFPMLKKGFDETMAAKEHYDLLLRISEIGLIYHIPAPLHTNISKKIDTEQQQLLLISEATAKEHAIKRRGLDVK